jgi:hypothetical protein
MPDRPNMLLVHGGHHDPWVWERLQSELRERGWTTQAVALPRAVHDPERAEPLPGMSTMRALFVRRSERLADL